MKNAQSGLYGYKCGDMRWCVMDYVQIAHTHTQYSTVIHINHEYTAPYTLYLWMWYISSVNINKINTFDHCGAILAPFGRLVLSFWDNISKIHTAKLVHARRLILAEVVYEISI